jgi:hypothetical protein
LTSGINWKNCQSTWTGTVGIISFNAINNSKQLLTSILINGHLTVQAADDVTGYIIQYLRRMVRSGVLRSIKIGQLWWIDMQSLETYLQPMEFIDFFDNFVTDTHDTRTLF